MMQIENLSLQAAEFAVMLSDPRQSIHIKRKAVADEIEALIAFLDETDGDCDLEDNADDEPWLGWTAYGSKADAGDDREVENEHYEDGGDDEPTLGSPEKQVSAVYWPHPWGTGGTLWTLERTTDGNQTHWADGKRGDHEREDENEHGGDVLDERHDALDEDMEPSLGWTLAFDQRVARNQASSFVVDGEQSGGLYEGYNPDDLPSHVDYSDARMAREHARHLLELQGYARRHDPDVLTIVGPGVARIGR